MKKKPENAKSDMNSIKFTTEQESEIVDMDVATNDLDEAAQKIFSGENHSFSILFVDDDPLTLKLLKRSYDDSGYSTYSAESAAKGLEILRSQPVDLVLSDMRMPEMGGVEFLEQVGKLYPSIRRIMMSGYFDINETINAINKGHVTGYIVKPWDNKNLKMVIYKALLEKKLEEDKKSRDRESKKNIVERTKLIGKSMRELKEENHQAIQVLIELLSELNDRRELDEGHSQRVAELCQKIGVRVSSDPGFLNQLYVASLLHDIGCIGLTDREVQLPSKALTPEELARFRTHPIKGEALIAAFPTYKQAAEMVRHHHEFEDGTGYPDGLAEQQIPLGAKIILVVSDYYQLAKNAKPDMEKSDERIRQWFLNNSGKRYDTHIVRTLIKMLDEEAS